MKKQILKSALIAVAGIGLLAGSAFAGIIPNTNWVDIEDFLAQSYFPGSETTINNLTFTGKWAYTAIGYEAGNVNKTYTVFNDASNPTFATNNTNNWGSWLINDFSVNNLYFTDGNPMNVALNPFLGTTSPYGFKIFQLVNDANSLTYLQQNPGLKVGDYIIGFNDNAVSPDADYDDIIIAMRPVPEPATMLLFGTGILGLAGIARRKKSN